MIKIVAIILALLGVTLYFLKLNAPEAKEWLKENKNKMARKQQKQAEPSKKRRMMRKKSSKKRMMRRRK